MIAHTVYMSPGGSVQTNDTKWDVKVECFLILIFQSHKKISKSRMAVRLLAK